MKHKLVILLIVVSVLVAGLGISKPMPVQAAVRPLVECVGFVCFDLSATCLMVNPSRPYHACPNYCYYPNGVGFCQGGQWLCTDPQTCAGG